MFYISRRSHERWLCGRAQAVARHAPCVTGRALAAVIRERSQRFALGQGAARFFLDLVQLADEFQCLSGTPGCLLLRFQGIVEPARLAWTVGPRTPGSPGLSNIGRGAVIRSGKGGKHEKKNAIIEFELQKSTN
jgi:hypothetical protein